MPGASGLLDILEPLGELHGCFGGFAANFSDIPRGLAGLPNGVQVIVLLRVEAMNGGSEPVLRGVRKASATPVEIGKGSENGLEFVQRPTQIVLVFPNALLQSLRCLLPRSAEAFLQNSCIADAFVGLKDLKVHVDIANCTGSAPNLAETTSKRSLLLTAPGEIGGVREQLP